MIGIRWFLRKAFYRRQFWGRAKKYYVAHWDMAETLLEIPFTMLEFFYEKSGIDEYIYWGDPKDKKQYKMYVDSHESEKEHLNEKWIVRQEIERLYFWWTVLRQKHYDKYNALLDQYFKKYPLRWGILENGCHELLDRDTPEAREEFKKICSIEDHLTEVDNKNLRSLISIKGHLWT